LIGGPYSPARTLLELAAALRLLEWQQKTTGPRRHGAATCGEAIRHVLLNANKDELQSQLSLQIVRVFAENFAGSAMRDLGAHVLLDKLGGDEHQLADYLAHLLLETLERGPNNNE
jgi:hypothetical protein